jgi:hypothetical protein
MLHNFGTPEIVHSKPKDEFLIFYVPKVSEMLRKTLKHHFGTNGLEWMLHNFVPRNSAFRLEHKFCIFYVSKVSECSETLPNNILGPMD